MADPFKDTVDAWPPDVRSAFEDIRVMIRVSASDAGCGPLTESLKWGQPAWRPLRSMQGSTLRLNWSGKSPRTLVFYVNCKTTLSETMRALYPTEFKYESNRALHLRLHCQWPEQAIDHLARLTFRYHLKT